MPGLMVSYQTDKASSKRERERERERDIYIYMQKEKPCRIDLRV